MADVQVLAKQLECVPVDADFVARDKLDVKTRERTSLYPWRGQFSPGLIATLLEANASDGFTILDPFVGSGTTLFECAHRGLACAGVEIHPAALAFSGMARFCNLEEVDRKEVCVRAEKLMDRWLGGVLPANLFRMTSTTQYSEPDQEMVRGLKDEAVNDVHIHDFVVSTLLLAARDNKTFSGAALESALRRNTEIVMALPFSREACQVLKSDARRLQIEASEVDLVVTSPPYINVFNYHHNFRPILELMGWRLLDVAPSELGANRKHRGNRFLTVIQFCMDLVQVFLEMKRVLRADGRAIVVIGRESKVRGVPFNNGLLLALAATSGAGFQLERWQERRFTNRFGTSIYEEIMTFQPTESTAADPIEFGREVGTWALRSAMGSLQSEILQDVIQALEKAPEVRPSPLLA